MLCYHKSLCPFYGRLGAQYVQILRQKAADGFRCGDRHIGAGCGGLFPHDPRPASQYGFPLRADHDHLPRRKPGKGGAGDHQTHGAGHVHPGSHPGGDVGFQRKRGHGHSGIYRGRQHGHRGRGYPAGDFPAVRRLVGHGGHALRAEDQPLHAPRGGGGGVHGGHGHRGADGISGRNTDE